MDYLKTIIPSNFIADRGSNLVVINPGSANVRIGLATQQAPFSIPHCIAHHVSGWDQNQKILIQNQMLNLDLSTKHQAEREQAYEDISSLLKIPSLHEEVASNSTSRKMGRVDGYYAPNKRNDVPLSWTNLTEESSFGSLQHDKAKTTGARIVDSECAVNSKLKKKIFGEDAMKISPKDSYCIRRPIRRGHFNVSLHYTAQQVIEDIISIWDWILNEKLGIRQADRVNYSAVVVLPETFDSREIKEILSIVLSDLQFGCAVLHQEALAATFGNGLSTACVVNIGSQVTSVMCIEDGVALPTTGVTLPFGGEDISRCLLWLEQHHGSWPVDTTNPVAKPINLLMLNKLKELYCEVKEGELGAVAVVHSYEDEKPPTSHKTKLLALNVPPMGLFFPHLLAPDEFPPPPRNWFHDYEDILEDNWHIELQRRPEMTDSFYSNVNGGGSIFDNYTAIPTSLKEVDNLGLAEAITRSILSSGRIDLQRKLFCSIQLIGGVGLTRGLVPVVEERVLHSIPANEAIDTVEVLPSRTDPTIASWKGGVILSILDLTHESWIHRDEWTQNGVYVGSGHKYKESYYIQALAMYNINI